MRGLFQRAIFGISRNLFVLSKPQTAAEYSRSMGTSTAYIFPEAKSLSKILL